MSQRLTFFHSTKLRRDSIGRWHSQTFIYEMWQRYLRVFDEVVFAARYVSGDTQGLSEVTGPGVTVSPLVSGDKWYSLYIETFKLHRRIRKLVQESDAVIARLPSKIGRIACKEAKKNGIPYGVEVVGCGWDSLWHHSWQGKILAPLSFLSMRQTVRKSPNTLYVTEKFLQSRYPTKGRQWTASDVEITVATEETFRHRLARLESLSSRPAILTTIGQVDVRYKGHETAIKAIRQILNEGHEIEYWIVGGGEQARLRSVAEAEGVTNYVKFLGRLTRSEVESVLARTDIYVQPSLTEGLPRAVIEAMSLGCAVIGSDVGGIPELLLESATFRKGQSADLALRVGGLLKGDILDSSRYSFQKQSEFGSSLLRERREDFYKALRD